MNTKERKESFKPYYGITFLIGLGFFTMGLMDPLYDTYVPVFLSRFIDSRALIGTIMTLDNIFAILFIPIVAALSDRTRTPIGRRMPYIIVTLPISAIAFALLPISAEIGLLFIILLIFFLNIFKQAARGPVVALMPDMVPGEFRSEANGVINTMGGIAAIVGTVGLARLMDVRIMVPGFGRIKNVLPFPLAALLVILAVLALFLFVKERPEKQEKSKEERVSVLASIKLIFTKKDSSAILILISIFLWFFGYQGVLPFIGLYSIEYLGTTPGTAALAAGMVAIAYALFAIPSGIIAHKFGRKRVIRVCLAALAIILVLLYFHHPLMMALGINPGIALYIFWGMMFFFGMFWGSVITNSFPMLWQMSRFANIGIYTGLYYFFREGAAISSPPVTGGIIDLFGFRNIFLFASFCMIGALVVMGFVTGGEVEKKEAVEESL